MTAALVFALTAPAAIGSSVRVPADYFGVNLQNSYEMTAERRAAHTAAIGAAGISQVRLPIPWSMIEPEPPSRGVHSYRWDKVDTQVQALARHGLRAQALFAYAPTWATNATAAEIRECRESGAAGLAPGTPKGYAAASRALAERYGRDGRFWAQNPGLDPRPIRLYEIWNAPNTAGAWCPEVDPEGYAILFDLAAQSIREVDSGAQVVVGGFGLGARTQNGSLATPDFIRRMIAAKPVINSRASAIAIHLYPGKDPDRQLVGLSTFRRWLRDATVPDSMPMLLNEIGFSRVGALPFTEPERVLAYQNVTSKLPRTNCNLSGVAQYTWTTRDFDTSDAEDFFGIARIQSGELYPSGEEYVRWARAFRGELAEEAPTATLEICPGMPKPDQDGDGVADEADYFPLDPDRTKPGDGGDGSGGDGSGGDGDSGAKRTECTSRLIGLTERIARAADGQRRALKRRYRLLERRCVPCERRIARLKRRLDSETSADARSALRGRLRRTRRSCGPCVRRLHQLQLASLDASDADRAALARRHERVRRRCRPGR